MPELLVVKIFRDHVDPSRIPDKDDCIREFLRLEMDMECRTVVIDDEFRFRYGFPLVN